MIVADVNTVAYLLIRGDKTALAQQMLRKDPEWFMPVLWQHEFLNVLATFVRHGGGKIGDAEQIWQTAVRLFRPREREVNAFDALRLAGQHNISAYDAQYIVLAQALGVICVTEDPKLASKFPTLTQSMQKFLDRPDASSPA